MPLTLRLNARNFPFQVVAKTGAVLPVVSRVTVTLDKPEIAAVSLDPSPTPVNNPWDPASGTPSIASGELRPLAVGEATASLNLGTATDTVKVVEPAEGTPEWKGTFFGATAPVEIPAAGSIAESTHATTHKSGHKL